MTSIFSSPHTVFLWFYLSSHSLSSKYVYFLNTLILRNSLFSHICVTVVPNVYLSIFSMLLYQLIVFSGIII